MWEIVLLKNFKLLFYKIFNYYYLFDEISIFYLLKFQIIIL